MGQELWYLLLGLISLPIGIYSFFRAVQVAIKSLKNKDLDNSASARIAKANMVTWIVGSFWVIILGVYMVIKFFS